MSTWRSAWLAAALGLLASAAEAQSTYAYRNDTFAYDTPSGGATTVGWHSSGASPGCTSYPNGDDDWADVGFPSGFTFTFGGTAYTGVRVYSNGILAFGNDVSGFHRNYTPQALPITGQALAGPSGCPRGVPARLMQAYWIDIVAGTANGTSGASVKYEMLGTAPNRRFVISWANVKLYNTTTRYNFQVALYESAADRKSTRLNSSHRLTSRMPSSA
jgi:MSHA biogenesis protein MshQ